MNCAACGFCAGKDAALGATGLGARALWRAWLKPLALVVAAAAISLQAGLGDLATLALTLAALALSITPPAEGEYGNGASH